MRPYKKDAFKAQEYIRLSAHALLCEDDNDQSLNSHEQHDIVFLTYRKAHTLLQAGKLCMRRMQYYCAKSAFEKAISCLKNCKMTSLEQKRRKKGMLIALFETLMICLNKMRRYRCVCHVMKDLRLLTINNPSALALCQHGRALSHLGKYYPSRLCYLKALKKSPRDKSIMNKITRINKRINDIEETSKMLSQLSI
ncbi:inactive peptidyl-prolyl cis-trans isomerase shutdown [Drosophila simulans]|uniref:GD11049 n=1 Tax=Drosophila simulans TaxID=7240 RepID=B4QFH1_DROSI|nr:inactive peptidyl-prolyl cis-trans isomerase shutdown [Drosophila simulans]XP_016027602.1 inactive peptidyl-prolyl cis-trans isomerase shutdown [Drosophila simulans]XP_016027603.1 inactive peptidyl-prolyl cis-trans isomerase shutdown [Drosophila simulans]XP_039147398.1 inactive peptidyl-prolyl cis-trans isomerase shutdown [Drosophila simulans]EDX07081.1 GD11049 [Drosophila simulans]KMY93762.1 uncharacterized protein Dsimw501_GD11049, isoform A [Drosophila simulans]KMY93763.1 uncharacterize